MARYSAQNGSSGQAVSSSYKSLISVWATTDVSALRRIKIYDVLVGTNGTPADNYMQWDISRQTATGVGTDHIPQALDPADVASATECTINATAEGTITASSAVFNVGVNQRASYRWVAAPGSELVSPATDNNGFALRVLSGGYTGTATGQILFDEQ